MTLEQSAILAGMLKGPEIYNPYYSVENATNRRNTVLQAMVHAGKITQEQADEASRSSYELNVDDLKDDEDGSDD